MMKKKIGFIILISLFLIIAVLAVVYFALFTKFTIVQDESWKMMMPKRSYYLLRFQLIKNSCRLNVITVKQDDVYDKDYLSDVFEKLDNGGFVLTSPVITASVNQNGINLKQLFDKTTVLGIGNNNDKEFFDTVLISNPSEGWNQAVKTSLKNTDKVALLYNDASLKEVGFITESLSGINYGKYNVDDYGNFADSEMLKVFKDSSINVVVCPFIDNMKNYFDNQSTQKWIVDYRFASAIRENYLLGFVYPDIYSSVKIYLEASILQNNSQMGILQYGYYEVK